MILLQACLTKFESIELKCYFTTLLYTITVNILFLEFTSKSSLLLMPVSLNQERGEIGTFYNRPTSQITEMAVSLFNILVNFTKYYLDNITKLYLYYLDSKYNFF